MAFAIQKANFADILSHEVADFGDIALCLKESRLVLR